MNSNIAFDQSDIDKIVAAAESDTIESKVAKLEEEVAEIKGSIKTLLMDIRETMGVLENPFQNIQGIATISGAIVSSSTPPKASDEPKTEDKLPKEEEIEDEPEIIDNKKQVPVESAPKKAFEDLKQAAKALPNIPDSRLIDPMSFYKTIVWSKDMVERYDYETITELVDIFFLLGYIKGDIKEIVLKLTELLDKSNDLDGAVMDLYRLYHILHPDDMSLDSKVLDYVLSDNEPRGAVREKRRKNSESQIC